MGCQEINSSKGKMMDELLKVVTRLAMFDSLVGLMFFFYFFRTLSLCLVGLFHAFFIQEGRKDD